MKFWFLVLIFLTPALSFAEDACVPNVDSCGFYACEEKRYNCGPHGYPLGFGFRFCRVFLNTEKDYSQPAQEWLRRVRMCLMTSFKQINSEDRKSCSKIRNESFLSHIGCYRKTGFCDLQIQDQWQIVWALRNSVIYPEAIRDGFRVMETCAFRTEPNPEDPSAPK